MIYIVRHGQTNWNLEGRYQGRIDIELNEAGIIQAQKTSKKLENVKFDKVFSSPLKRAYKTAQIITNNNIIIDERLIERCNGKLEGMLKEDCKKTVNFADCNDLGLGIEPLEIFRKRIYDFLDEIMELYKDKNVLIVTHAGVSIYVKCYFEGDPIDGNYDAYKLKNCEILEYSNN